jgi:3-phenylpropionate/cinnamic acid dioxygenase small subunit
MQTVEQAQTGEVTIMVELTMEKLLERARIEDLLNRYATALDSRDWAALDQVFAPNATAHFQGIGHFEDRDAIVAVIRSVLGQCGPTQHLLGNMRIEINGEEAHAKSYLQAIHAGLGKYAGEKMTVWGEYRDTLKRTPQGWRIVHRELVAIHGEGDIGAAVIRRD